MSDHTYRPPSRHRHGRLPIMVVLVSAVLMAFLLVLPQPTQAAFPPNHFLGTCLTKEWVASMEAQLGVSSTERDKLNRLVHPFLRAASKYPRYIVRDPRTSLSGIYNPDCMRPGSKMYGVGAQLDANGALLKQGKIAETLVVEVKTWATQIITSMVFSILVAEMYGYEVSMYVISESSDLTQRMSSVHAGLCTPVHLNFEVWIAGIESKLDRYINESIAVGGIGYFGRAGLYTSVDFVKEMLNTTKYPAGPHFANFWKGYQISEELIQRVPKSTLMLNPTFYPPAVDGCANGVRGCMNQCSKSAACTARENAPGPPGPDKECLVVVMMYDSYDPGYLQAAMANNNIPAYFCFLGYGGAIDYIVYAQQNKIPVLFYHYEPDPFHVIYAGLFDRVFLPRPEPERVILATSGFGELGYGMPTTNMVDVDFPNTKLTKYAAALLYNLNEDGPVGSLVSKITLTELHMNDMLRKHGAVVDDPTKPSPEFQAACQWLKENYAVWKFWLDRLPLCTFEDHIKFDIAGCVDANATGTPTGSRTVTFAWKTPDPGNPLLPYACDGGLTEYPKPLQTSRSCEWLRADTSKWVDWIAKKPACDTSFYDYSVSDCDSHAKRTVHYFWLLPDPSDASKSLECDATTLSLPEDVLVDCEYVPFSTPLFQTIAVFDGIVTASIIGLMVFVYVCRKAPIIKRSQFELLLLMLSGGVLVCLSALVYAGEPSYFLCAARPLLVSSGFTTIFGALFVKSLRVYRVFMKSAMKRVTITMAMMVKVLAVFYAVDAIILGVWFVADFPKPIVTLEQAREFRGSVSRVACVSKSFIFSALLMFWKAIVLLLGLYTSFLIRNVSADFQESIWIFSASVIVLVGCLVILPLAYMVEMPASPFYGFLAASLLLCTVVVMTLMLIPKIFRLKAESSSAGSSKYASGKTAMSSHETGTGNRDSTNAGSTQLGNSRVVVPVKKIGT